MGGILAFSEQLGDHIHTQNGRRGWGDIWGSVTGTEQLVRGWWQARVGCQQGLAADEGLVDILCP